MKNVYNSPPSPVALELQARLAKPEAASANSLRQSHVTVDLKSRESVDIEAGVKEELAFLNKTLEQRRVPVTVRTAPRGSLRDKSRSQQASKAAHVGSPGQLDEGHDEWHPVQRALEMLREDSSQQGRAAAEAMLAERFDMVQSYNALLEALREADQLEGLSAYRKRALKGALNEMMSDMMQRSSGDLRHTLQETEELHGAMESMAEEPLPTTRELRFLIGGKAKGRVDVPLTPLSMLKALIRNFGAEHCVSAMESLRSRMMAGL
ncbi:MULTISPECIES: hypothetical protein [unclassified Duganella]|uniref:hypothetical protein n=1 Tax=unclassified Duganella TaxID=2636909 RepID=UPI000A9B9A69|nr:MULTISPECIES: hypothetical protein [unclassified Duganella]